MANEGQGSLTTIMSAVTLTGAYTGNSVEVAAGKARKLTFYVDRVGQAADYVYVEVSVRRRGGTYSVQREDVLGDVPGSPSELRYPVRFAEGETHARLRVMYSGGTADKITAKVRADAVDVPITTS